jgi:hypothetical protein
MRSARRTDLRGGRENLPLKHHSARGKPPRNSGNFTRGGQLVTHEWLMFIGAAKIPFLIWLAVVVAVYWIVMIAVMGEHEIQLVTWRVGSALWTWMDFSPLKPMNIVLADDSIRRVSTRFQSFDRDAFTFDSSHSHQEINEPRSRMRIQTEQSR